MPEEAPEELRSRLALAFDVDDLVAASRLARDLKPWFGVAKVGLELYSAVGPDAIGALRDYRYRVFCDLKLHDIPHTVERSARVLGALGRVCHLPCARRCADAPGRGHRAHRGGRGCRTPEPVGLAVTVLTSDADARLTSSPKRVRVAAEAGCRGLVCPAEDLKTAVTQAPRWGDHGLDPRTPPARSAAMAAEGRGARRRRLLVLSRRSPRRRTRRLPPRPWWPLSPRAALLPSANDASRTGGACSQRQLAASAHEGSGSQASSRRVPRSGQVRTADARSVFRAPGPTRSWPRPDPLKVLQTLPKTGKVKANRAMQLIGISRRQRPGSG